MRSIVRGGVLSLCSCALWIGVGAVPGHAAEATVVLEVQAGACDREGVPVEADLPADVPPGGQLELIRLDTQQPVPIQVVAGRPSRLVWMIDGRLAAGKSRRYRLATSRVTAAAENPVIAVQTEGRVLLKVGPLSVLQYHVGILPSADPEQPYFARSGFIHPVFDPQKRMLTDAMPPDQVFDVRHHAEDRQTGASVSLAVKHGLPVRGRAGAPAINISRAWYGLFTAGRMRAPLTKRTTG